MHLLALALAHAFAFAAACALPSPPAASAAEAEAQPVGEPAPAPEPEPDPFDDWLGIGGPPTADGFDPPIANAARCGDGCWRPKDPARSDVAALAVAAGVVRSVDGNTVVTEHRLYDDALRVVAVAVAGVRPSVAVGQVVGRGEAIGALVDGVVGVSADVGGEYAGPEGVDPFFASHARLIVPAEEPVLAVVDRSRHQLRLYAHGVAAGSYETYEIGLGQAEGDKEQRGDNRTPRGLYRVLERSRGPFSGPFADFYGGHWVKLSYPNAWDAARGVEAELITAEVGRAITAASRAGTMPPQKTRLGGGIGLHGWAAEWPDDSDRLMSWGCVVAHLSDVGAIYDGLPIGALVAIR